MHAVILAGGFGTRLRSVVSEVPKPLAPIQGKPFLAWLVDALAAQGVTGVTLSVHHQWEKIRDYFTAHSASIPVDYVVEAAPLGTGGAMQYVYTKQKFVDPILVLNGDTFVQVDLQALYAQHLRSQVTLTMVLRSVPDSGRYGTVEVEQGIITAFGDGAAGKQGLINAGVYVMTPAIFSAANMGEAFSFERDFLPPRLTSLKPHAFMAEDYFIDIGIPEDYARAQVELPQMMALNSSL